MWRANLILLQALTLSQYLWAQEDLTAISPQNCSLECVLQVYQSDSFSRLDLGAQYAVTVMALPVPELWDQFYHSTMFTTRTCPEKNGLEHCKKDWYPKHIEVQQEGSDIIVTFNLAPPHFGINRYFSLCYGGGLKRYIIKPNSTKNRTHYSYHLQGLVEGSNYTCEIAVDEVDAVRKTFNVQVMQIKHEPPPTATPSLTLLLPVGVALAAMLVVLLLAVIWKNPRQNTRKTEINHEIIEQHLGKNGNEEHVSLTSTLTPPRLLICYSSDDGIAHVRAVMQLAVFLQQHMATQVYLDLWDSLSLAEEGPMGWHCRRIQESDFVLVICSRGLQRRPSQSDEAQSRSSAAAVVALVGEELGSAKAKGRDISKYMAAIFEYSEEKDIPAQLGFVSRYTLTRDLPLLFSHLHGVALHRPGGYLRIEHITEEGYTKLPAGAALQWSIQEAGMALSNHQESSDAGGDKEHDKHVE
ncbi:hypothetical protein J4Q44_G00264100 [Coregonus suidteri]|uniref:SEFIR domain-containing protein n=1 Tax=Coregonus suidteri TaxID=861788 RepID=A0AAN8LHU0_9TELE